MDPSLRRPVIEVDLAVVGAGPAGSAAALRAGAVAPDLVVALVDAADFPRDKVCGDGIGPEGLDVLERLDAAAVVADAPRLDRLEVVAPSGRRARGRAPRPGVVVPRRVFDARLRDVAIARGARPIRHRVRHMVTDGDHVRLDDVLRARWVVAADGANSAVARAIGRPRPPRDRTGLAMRGYADMPDLDALTIWFVADRWPAYAWAFPIGDGTANVGYGPFDATTISSRRDLEDSLGALFGDAGVDPTTLAAHHLPLSPARTSMGQGRVLVAGDAANLVHPLTGEGIYYALLSGAMAGAAVARHLVGSGDGDGPGPLVTYRRALRGRLGRHLRHTDVAAAMLVSSLPVEVAVAAAADDDRSLATLAEFALGTGRIDTAMVMAMTTAWWRHRPFDRLVRSSRPPFGLPGERRAPKRRGASRGP